MLQTAAGEAGQEACCRVECLDGQLKAGWQPNVMKEVFEKRRKKNKPSALFDCSGIKDSGLSMSICVRRNDNVVAQCAGSTLLSRSTMENNIPVNAMMPSSYNTAAFFSEGRACFLENCWRLSATDEIHFKNEVWDTNR